MSNESRRPMDLSPLWLQALLLTFVVGFAILGYLATAGSLRSCTGAGTHR